MSGYQPPPGPPPGRASEYQPPSGPPPGRFSEYQPPLGPPPGRASVADEPPPPYHDWTSVPDTALLPPPPGLSHDFSSGANATKQESDRAARWCAANPLWAARQLSWEQLNAVHLQNHTLIKPPSYAGDLFPDNPAPAIWRCRTRPGCTDSLLQTALPVYSAPADSPLLTERKKTIYFEVKILGIGRHANGPAVPGVSGVDKPKSSHNPFSRLRHHHEEPKVEEDADAGIAIGFFAPPYPSFRLPGWQRGSLGIHSDDGRRYVNDTHGGLDFTSPFKAGQTVGVGMTFKIPDRPPAYGEQSGGVKLDIEVFFTRDGKKAGGWNLHEERDVEDDDMGVRGLEGDFDIFSAVGVFGVCDFEVRLQEKDWLYRPPA